MYCFSIFSISFLCVFSLKFSYVLLVSPNGRQKMTTCEAWCVLTTSITITMETKLMISPIRQRWWHNTLHRTKCDMSDGKKMVPAGRTKFKTNLTTRFLAKFEGKKPLWSNGFNFVLPETRKKTEKTWTNTYFPYIFRVLLFFVMFSYIFCVWLCFAFFCYVCGLSGLVWTEVQRPCPSPSPQPSPALQRPIWSVCLCVLFRVSRRWQNTAKRSKL